MRGLIVGLYQLASQFKFVLASPSRHFIDVSNSSILIFLKKQLLLALCYQLSS